MIAGPMLGKPAKLRMDWHGAGDGPQVGSFMKSTRGRIVYQITAVTKARRAGFGTSAVYKLICERWSPENVPEGVVIEEFYWHSRNSKHKR